MRPSSLLLLCTASAAFQPPALRRPPLRTKETVADLDLLDVRGGAAISAPSAMDEFVGEAAGTALLLTLGYGAVASGASGDLQGRTRVIQRRFNVSVPRARVSETAPTLRERSER